MPLYVRTLLVTGPREQVVSASAGHREHLRDLRAQGRLRVAGALGDGEGFLEIFEARDRREAEATARASPLVEDGLGAWMLREWVELDLG
jgi:uncharacterized protein YciI